MLNTKMANLHVTKEDKINYYKDSNCKTVNLVDSDDVTNKLLNKMTEMIVAMQQLILSNSIPKSVEMPPPPSQTELLLQQVQSAMESTIAQLTNRATTLDQKIVALPKGANHLEEGPPLTGQAQNLTPHLSFSELVCTNLGQKIVQLPQGANHLGEGPLLTGQAQNLTSHLSTSKLGSTNLGQKMVQLPQGGNHLEEGPLLTGQAQNLTSHLLTSELGSTNLGNFGQKVVQLPKVANHLGEGSLLTGQAQNLTPHLSISEKWRIYTEMYQIGQQSCKEYCVKKMRLGQQLGLSFKDTKREMIIGLWSNRLAVVLYLKQHDTEEDLMKEIDEWEKIDSARSVVFKKYRNKCIRNNL